MSRDFDVDFDPSESDELRCAPTAYVPRVLTIAMNHVVAELEIAGGWGSLRLAEHRTLHRRNVTRPTRLVAQVSIDERGDFGFHNALRMVVRVRLPTGESVALLESVVVVLDRPRYGRGLTSPLAVARAGACLGRTAVTIETELPARFAELSGDYNPIHLDPVYAREAGLKGVVVHGVAIIGRVVRAVANELGRGTDELVSTRARLAWPVYPGTVLDVAVHATDTASTFRVFVRQGRREMLKDVEVAFESARPEK